MDPEAVIDTESERFAEVLATTPADARVPTCPDWTASDLLWHLTEVHLFWAGVLGRPALTDADAEAVEQSKPPRPATLDEALALRRRATDSLRSQLRMLDDAEPRWSWWEPDQTVGFTRRMQTYEATFHRVDAELTAGRPISPIAPDVAAGAIDHAVDVMWAWRPDWASYEKRAVAELLATDVDQHWLVELGRWTGTGPESGRQFDGARAVRVDAGDPQITVTASVLDLALWAWTRGGAVQIAGSADARAALDAVIIQGMT